LDQALDVGQLLGRVGVVVVDLHREAASVDAAVVVDVVHAGGEADRDLLAVGRGRTGGERRPADADLGIVGPVVVDDVAGRAHESAGRAARRSARGRHAADTAAGG